MDDVVRLSVVYVRVQNGSCVDDPTGCFFVFVYRDFRVDFDSGPGKRLRKVEKRVVNKVPTRYTKTRSRAKREKE